MKKLVSSLFVAGSVIGGTIYILSGSMQNKNIPPWCRNIVVTCDTYAHAEGYSRKRFRALECEGEVVQPIEKHSDPLDEFEIVGFCEKDLSKETPGKAENVNFRCVHQPKGGGAAACMRLRKSDGKFVDPGPENAFPIGEAVGDDCVPRPCVEVMGIPFKAVR